jgi:hypothetical protein
MELRYDTRTPEDSLLARTAALSAGDVSLAVRAELTRMLAASGGDRRKATAAGFDELVKRNALSGAEAAELAPIMDLLFDTPDGTDPKLAERVRAYYRMLALDPSSSPAALAIASVINSLLRPSAASGGGPTAQAVSKGDALFGGFGAVVGAGIGAGFGGPIGAGIGAVVGAAVGVCIEES